MVPSTCVLNRRWNIQLHVVRTVCWPGPVQGSEGHRASALRTNEDLKTVRICLLDVEKPIVL